MNRPARRPAPLLVAALLVACSSGDPTPEPTARATPTVAPSVPASAAPSVEPTDTPESAPATIPPIADEPPALALELVGDAIVAPVGITAAPGGWLLVSEQRGRVLALDPDSGEQAEVVNLSDRIRSGGEQGLLGLALHPDWPADARAFVHYSDASGNTVISVLSGAQSGDGPPTLDPGSERVLLQVTQPYTNHNGGQLSFGPDGYLYIGLGDGGSGGDPHGHGQNPATLLGSILRVDASGDAFAIPPDNPFADGGGAPEVFLIGLRNPWRFSFDPLTDLLWIGDVGQGSFEEINRVDPATDGGANLGWNLMEGAHCYVSGCSPDGLVLPVTEYGRDLGCSVTGGYVYRGSAIADLAGWYLFGDYCSGNVFGVRSDATATTAPRVLIASFARISAFGEGTDGELYLADINGGAIYRIAAAGG